jgi:4-diphosphocytidyl-2-C-methyl-D-erythritol kinase
LGVVAGVPARLVRYEIQPPRRRAGTPATTVHTTSHARGGEDLNGRRKDQTSLPGFAAFQFRTLVSPISIFAPAKLNLFLAVTGRRADGFHDLVSVVAQLNFGDTLTVQPAPEFSLRCTDPDVPVDDGNLVLKAARAFAAATEWRGGAAFVLEKTIPVGAGLGGGSSDAVAALRALNRLVEPARRLSEEKLTMVAAQLGSDCPLFLHDQPIVMRGRGELISPLAAAAVSRLRGRRVVVFKPGFGISTPWSYGRLAAAAPGGYCPPAEAEARLGAWLANPAAPAEELLFNNLEPPAFTKFLALSVLFRELERRFQLRPRMSGSGSACFALLDENTQLGPILVTIREAWGASAFVTEATLT